jgi:DNA gyrase subunit A
MLNVTMGRRDGSGEKLDKPIAAISGPIGEPPEEDTTEE